MQVSLCIPAPWQGESGRAAALTCYAEVLRRDARHAPAWRGLGDARREAGEHAEAVACYQVGGRLVGRLAREGSSCCGVGKACKAAGACPNRGGSHSGLHAGAHVCMSHRLIKPLPASACYTGGDPAAAQQPGRAHGAGREPARAGARMRQGVGRLQHSGAGQDGIPSQEAVPAVLPCCQLLHGVTHPCLPARPSCCAGPAPRSRGRVPRRGGPAAQLRPGPGQPGWCAVRPGGCCGVQW